MPDINRRPELQYAFAVQEPTGKTNLGDDTAELLKRGGVTYTIPRRKNWWKTNLPEIDIWEGRNSQISLAVSMGAAQWGIVGLDKLTELEETPDTPTPIILKKLGYSHCTLKLGVREDIPYKSPEDLSGLVVATSYPRGTRRFFENAGVSVRILKIDGGVEAWVDREVAHATVDVSVTGDSFQRNRIKDVATVLESEAVLIANPRLKEDPESAGASWRAIRAVMTGIYDRDLTMMKVNFPAELRDTIVSDKEILPARKSPTILATGDPNLLAAESLVPKVDYNKIKQILLNLGAEDVFKLPVEDPSPNYDDPEVNRMMKMLYGQDWVLPKNAYPIA